VTEAESSGKRRRRRRSSKRADAPSAVPRTDEVVAASPPRRAERKRAEPGERGLRDLVGAGPSQLGVSGALRGRDVNRPTDEDLAEAERTIVIVRRGWKPPS
jgi:hypothetical protein